MEEWNSKSELSLFISSEDSELKQQEIVTGTDYVIIQLDMKKNHPTDVNI
jgi:hypothetical protein